MLDIDELVVAVEPHGARGAGWGENTFAESSDEDELSKGLEEFIVTEVLGRGCDIRLGGGFTMKSGCNVKDEKGENATKQELQVRQFVTLVPTCRCVVLVFGWCRWACY